MKKSALYIALIIAAMPVFAQTEITKANDCYNKEDYQCAVDNYLMALDKKSYKEGDLYLVEYRIGDSYSALKQFDKSNEYLLKAISSRPDYFWGYLSLADNYYDTKKYQEALKN